MALLKMNLKLLNIKVLSNQISVFSPSEKSFYLLYTWSDAIFLNYLIKSQGLVMFIFHVLQAMVQFMIRRYGNGLVLPEVVTTLNTMTYTNFLVAVEKYYLRQVWFGNALAITALNQFTTELITESNAKADADSIGISTLSLVGPKLEALHAVNFTLSGPSPINTVVPQEITVAEEVNTFPLFSPVAHYAKDNKNVFAGYGHPFHLVDPSPWPFCVSMGLWYIAFTTVACFHKFLASPLNVIAGLVYLCLNLGFWWRDVIRESTYEFKHTPYVRRGLLTGMLLFIISEIMFFFGFFWAFFHASLVPSHFIGGVWPPLTIDVISPWQLPLVNTLCLLLSGVTLTIAHRQLNGLSYYNQTVSVHWPFVRRLILWLQVTVALGVFFLGCQAVEYYLSPFTFQDTVFGGTFYILTGLHGMHVLVGTVFLIVCLWRASRLHFTMWKQVGFKSAVWYWHFVDVVWIFLFLVIYVWGGL